jgi:NAD(P)-dependent dehydrogenase (short-subunit alcohol dehydrogenase family)
MSSAPCHRKHVLVTGSNSGIGRATVDAMAARGWHVFAGLHHADHPGDPYDEQYVTSLTVDVTDVNQLASAVKSVSEHVGEAGLDGLVDNAGIGIAGPLEVLPLDQLRLQFEVNVIGQVAVTQQFLPLLRQATGHIVFISSIGDRMAMPFAGPLTSSKAALSMIAHSWRQELAPWDIGVSIVAPALIHTEAADKLERAAKSLLDDMTEPQRRLYGTVFSGMVQRAIAQEKSGSPPTAVAKAVAEALTARRPPARRVAGKAGRLLSLLTRLPTPMLDALRRRLFHLPEPGSARHRTD